MGLTKPIEQNKLSYQGTFMYLKNIIRGDEKIEDVEKTDFLYLGSRPYDHGGRLRKSGTI